MAAAAAALPLLAAAGTPLNVLFLAVDDLRPELSPYGPDPVPGTVTPPLHTPNFERLAKKSLLAKRNYCQVAVCGPTRASLLTGRRPDRTRVYDLYSYWRDVAGNYTTIPQYFKQQGYYTVGMGKIFHPGHASGGAGGPGSTGDDSCCSWSNAAEYYHSPNLHEWSGTARRSLNKGQSWYAATTEEEAANPLPDSQVADRAVEVIQKLPTTLKSGQPFFVAVGFHKPHLPFTFPKAMLDYYPESAVGIAPSQQPPEGMPEVAWFPYPELLAYADLKSSNGTGAAGTVLALDEQRTLRRAYYAAVSATDLYLGRVLDALDASAYAKNTIVSLWGDHGWQLGEHGEWCKQTNFEFAARAPLMISVPGLTDAGVTTDRYTSHADVFPTLVEAALGSSLERCPDGDGSFKVATCTEGYSLLPLMRNAATPAPNHAFSQYPRSTSHGGDAQPSSPSPCITAGDTCTMGYSVVGTFSVRPGEHYRYTMWCDFNTKTAFKADMSNCPFSELYNHTADPGENTNIAAQPGAADVVSSLSALIADYAAGKW
eukprot:TRINITY_DN2067_c0_g5_i1.p2 TRINITY_DN2067_c0_g5~~TRINITY_DN2067_c0_g5_i1.p2  ORF type:complete len:542 (+),score=187.98 TRINITY_DN2067_c0_g5_i1:81-1706(+)